MSPERQERSKAEASRMLAGLTPEVSHTITILQGRMKLLALVTDTSC